MSVVAESALEVDLEIESNAQVLCNLELNNTCRFTTDCGDACILNQIAPRAPAMSAQRVAQVGREIIDAGDTIRHVVLAGKEPLETPDRVLGFLHAYHQRPLNSRPGAVGLLTSGINLDQHIDAFARTPLSWCITSLDAERSGLRSTQATKTNASLQTLTDLKAAGGARLIGINSVVAMDAETELMPLAEQIDAAGVDQWALSPLLVPHKGAMKPYLPLSLLAPQLERLAHRLANLRTVVSFDVDPATFERLSGGIGVAPDQWRSTFWLTSNVRLTAKSPAAGYFFRLRFDGQLLSRDDFLKQDLREGTYGPYSAGRIKTLVDKLGQLRQQKVAA